MNYTFNTQDAKNGLTELEYSILTGLLTKVQMEKERREEEESEQRIENILASVAALKLPIFGSPFVGKSDLIEQLAKEHGFTVVKFNLSDQG